MLSSERDLFPEDLKEALEARILRLRQTAEPLRDDLFLANSPERKLELQPGFVFWPENLRGTQSDVFFTISSVVQQLRANSQRPDSAAAIKSNWFQQTILAAGNFGRFNDDAIQASILRSADPYEMNYSEEIQESQELGRLIRRIIEAAETPRGGAAAEFLLALATKRLVICKSDLQEIISTPAHNSRTVSFLQKICEIRLM